MSEAIIVIRNGSPMAKWYGLYATGHGDAELFEESLMLNMRKYNPLNPKVIDRFPCENSLAVLTRLQEKLNAEGANHINGIWFNETLVSIRRLAAEVIREIGKK